MINDIKMSFKILKYGISVKTSVVFIITFAVLGLLLDRVGSSRVAGFYMPLISIYIGQMAHSVVQSTMVQSSPHKKEMQTKIPALAMTVMMLVYNTLLVLWRLILLQVNPERELEFILAGIVSGIITIIIMLYFAFAMKIYWPATICFFLVFYAYGFGAGWGQGMEWAGRDLGQMQLTLSLFGATLFSYISILVGGLINYAVNIMLYKRDYSHQNFKKALDRAK